MQVHSGWGTFRLLIPLGGVLHELSSLAILPIDYRGDGHCKVDNRVQRLVRVANVEGCGRRPGMQTETAGHSEVVPSVASPFVLVWKEPTANLRMHLGLDGLQSTCKVRDD